LASGESFVNGAAGVAQHLKTLTKLAA